MSAPVEIPITPVEQSATPGGDQAALFWKCHRRRRRFPKDGRDGDEQAAYAVAAWLQRADQGGSLKSFFKPMLTPEEREVAVVEMHTRGGVNPLRESATENKRP